MHQNPFERQFLIARLFWESAMTTFSIYTLFIVLNCKGSHLLIPYFLHIEESTVWFRLRNICNFMCNIKEVTYSSPIFST